MKKQNGGTNSQKAREAERASKAELRASQLRRKQATKRHVAAAATTSTGAGGALSALTLTRSRPLRASWLTGLWAPSATKTTPTSGEAKGVNTAAATGNKSGATGAVQRVRGGEGDPGKLVCGKLCLCRM